MLDQAKSSANPRRTLAGAVPQPPDAEQAPIPEGLSRSALHEPLNSIRVAESPGTLCAACRKEETGTGPVGYLDDEPICDLCLLKRSTDFRLMLRTIAVGGTAEQQVFARIYHRVPSKS